MAFMGLSKTIFEMYSLHIANFITEGKLINRAKMSPSGVRAVHSKILTKNMEKRVLEVLRIPYEFTGRISEELNEQVGKSYPHVKLNIVVITTPTKVEINSDLFKSELSRAVNNYEGIKDSYNSLSWKDRIYGLVGKRGKYYYNITKERVREFEIIKDSYLDAVRLTKERHQFNQCILTVEISSPVTKDLDTCFEMIQNYFTYSKFEQMELSGSYAKYLSTLSPTGCLKLGEKAEYPYAYNLFYDSNYEHIFPSEINGLTGDGKGILFGSDIENRTPVTLPMTSTGSAQVVLICAATGRGKTFISNLPVDSALAQHIHVSIVDVKGYEWTPKVDQLGFGKVINFGGGHPKFVNLLNLSDLEVNRETCAEYYDNAKKGITELCFLLCNIPVGERLSDSDKMLKASIETFVPSSVDKLFNSLGVFRNSPNSFRNTRGNHYKELLSIISTQVNSKSVSYSLREFGDRMINYISDFFTGRGLYRGMQENEITLADIIREPLIIYSLDKNNETDSTTIDAIRYFHIQYLDKKKQTYRKNTGKFTMVLFEELQRSAEFARLMTYIAGTVTGGRSNNIITIMLCNTLATFSDKNNVALQQIASNINTYLIGPVGKNDVRILEENFTCNEILHHVKKMSFDEELHDKGEDTEAQSGEERAKYDRAFALLFKDGEIKKTRALVRASVPKDLEKSRSTRTMIED